MAGQLDGADFAYELQQRIGALRLGDQRLNRRLAKMTEDCLASSKPSLSAMFGADGIRAQKAAQTVLNNAKVDVLALRQTLYADAVQRINQQKLKRVVAAYDPTLLDFSRQCFKTGRMKIGNGGGLGYIWLNSALVDPISKRVLGVAHQALVYDEKPDDSHVVEYAPGVEDAVIRAELESNPGQQFLACAREVDARLPRDINIIHVADREFDDGLALRALCEPERNHFVIRGRDRRVVQVRRGDAQWLPENLHRKSTKGEFDITSDLVNVHISDLAKNLPLVPAKQLSLDSRGRVCPEGQKPCRIAELSVGGIAIRLARQSGRGKSAEIEEKPVWLNLVVVRELHPPEGRTPLRWLLLTDLPISTKRDLLEVVELYESRWRIEEFFRTAKDVLRLEASELHGGESTGRFLFFATVKSMLLDELRARAEIPAGKPPTKEQRQALNRGADRAKEIEDNRRKRSIPVPKLSSHERAVMALGLIARHGCWTSRSGVSLGNYVLMRGLPIFLHDVREGRYAWLLDEEDDG